MAIEIILVLVLILGILTATIIIVAREFKLIKDRLKGEEQVSRLNEQVMGSNLSVTSKNIMGHLTTEANALRSTMNTADTSIKTDMAQNQAVLSEDISQLETIDKQFATQLDQLKNNDSQFQTSLNELRQEDTMFLNKIVGLESEDAAMAGTIASLSNDVNQLNFPTTLNVYSGDMQTSSMITSDPLNGLTIKNQSTNGGYDISADRGNFGTSLNLAGTLNFASNNSSYLLGVDATSMYLKMDNPNKQFQVRDSFNVRRLTVGQNAVQIGTDLNIATNKAKYTFEITDDDLNIVPRQPADGGIIMRDTKNVARLSVRDSNIQLQGNMNVNGPARSTRVISQNDVCVKSECLGEKDVATLKKMISKYTASNVV